MDNLKDGQKVVVSGFGNGFECRGVVRGTNGGSYIVEMIDDIPGSDFRIGIYDQTRIRVEEWSNTSIIHVNRQFIAMNAKDGHNRPVYTIKTKNKPTRYAREVIIHSPSRAVYNGTQLTCGARAWIEVDGRIDLVDEMSFEEAKKYIET